MRNWSTDVSKFDKNSDEYKRWRLEQLINFGLNGEKLNKAELEQYFNVLVLDRDKRIYIDFLLHGNT